MKKFLLTLTAALMLLNNVKAQYQKAENDIDALMQSLNTVGLSVAVVKNNTLVYAKSFGKKDIEKNIALQNTDMFRIASISKSFTATAIMQLVEAKKFKLDDDFSDLVGFKVVNPNFPNQKITLRMVLSHTSSINDSEGYFNLDAINPAKNPNWAKCYNNYAPGTKYQYCNLNYNMTGAVIERFTNTRFDNYIKANILSPLGLYGGYCVDSLDNNRLTPLYEFDAKTQTMNLAEGAYNPRREELKNYQLGYTTPTLSPTGGMKISATDLAKYMMMHMNYGKTGNTKIISKKYSKLMQTPVSTEENYGFALSKSDKLVDGKTLVGHTGSAYGLYSIMFFDPKEKFGIVIITNGTNPTGKDGYRTIIKDTYNILYSAIIAQ